MKIESICELGRKVLEEFEKIYTSEYRSGLPGEMYFWSVMFFPNIRYHEMMEF